MEGSWAALGHARVPHAASLARAHLSHATATSWLSAWVRIRGVIGGPRVGCASRTWVQGVGMCGAGVGMCGAGVGGHGRGVHGG